MMAGKPPPKGISSKDLDQQRQQERAAERVEAKREQDRRSAAKRQAKTAKPAEPEQHSRSRRGGG